MEKDIPLSNQEASKLFPKTEGASTAEQYDAEQKFKMEKLQILKAMMAELQQLQ